MLKKRRIRSTMSALEPALDNIVSKMNMGSSPPNACKISMLWNWYTIDSCFIARSWHVKTKGAFAGSCVGVFFLVLASQWLHRFCREYDQALIAKKRSRAAFNLDKVVSTGTEKLESSSEEISSGFSVNPMLHALSHRWMAPIRVEEDTVLPTIFEHVIRTVLFTIEWGLSYIIMLLFMYYNGYIIISCILGALIGKLIFTYNEPLLCRGVNIAEFDSHEGDRKCCR